MRYTICLAEGLPLPPIACDRHLLRSASALRAQMSLREAGPSNSVVLTIIMDYNLVDNALALEFVRRCFYMPFVGQCGLGRLYYYGGLV